MRRLAVGLAGVLLLAASGGGGTKTYESVQQLHDGLAKAGVPCDDYRPNTDVIAAREDGSRKTTGGGRISLTIYNSAEQRQLIRDTFAALRTGVDVDGPLWTVNGPTREMGDKVAAALGGKVV